MEPELQDQVAVAYADRWGKGKEVKCGYIIGIVKDTNNFNVYKIRITSGEKPSTIHISEMDRHRFMTLKEIDNGGRK